MSKFCNNFSRLSYYDGFTNYFASYYFLSDNNIEDFDTYLPGVVLLEDNVCTIEI